MIIKKYTKSNCIIDREDDVNQIKNHLNNAICSQVHIVFAKTGYGKSFFTAKLSQENQFSNWDIIRIMPIPKNTDKNVPEGYYLNLIFESAMKHFKDMGHSKLFFESYLKNGHNKLVERIALDETVNELSNIASIKSALPKLIGIESKRRLGTGAFNPYIVINDNSPIARSVKAEYIRFLFEQAHILLIVENIQNIDDISCKFLLDWINDTKDKKHVFILEYTISETHEISDMNLFKNTILKTGVEVLECELEKMPVEYIADIIDSQIDNHPSDIHFTIEAQQHYENISNGNLWDLMDFARVYDDKEQDDEIVAPTLLILRNLSKEAQYIVSILACHSGTIYKNLLNHIWVNEFSRKSTDVLDTRYVELINKHTISIAADKINISHASILDVWHSSSEFIYISRDTYKRLEKFYKKNYNGELHIVNKESAWQMLVRIYANTEPDKISDLLNDFKLNIMKTVSRSNTWDYLKMLIDATKECVAKLEDVYFQILRICCSASLYQEGFDCIKLMEQQIDIEKNDDLLLNKLLYLSILDEHDTAIELYKNSLEKNEINQQTFIKLKLLILNSYIVLGDRKSCLQIDSELKHMSGFKHKPEYAIYLRLTNIYKVPSYAVKDAKKSIDLFHKQDDYIQEGKSYITYSKLLSSLGKHKKAIKMIKRAKQLLEESNEGLSNIYNNLAGYLLLSGEYGLEVWNYLDIAEIYSVSTYDKLSIIQNKLAWCYENNSFVRLDLLENKALELIELEPSQSLQCTALYNLYVTMEKAGLKEKANKYYLRVLSLKDKCSYVRARIDGITRKNRYIKPRIKKPYHVCYLSFWVFDL